jgi:hypothetical protein
VRLRLTFHVLSQGLPKVGLGWGGNRAEVERQVVQLVEEGISAAKDRQGNFEKTQRSAASAAATPAPAPAQPASTTPQTPPAQSAVKKGMV